jgi:zinc transport system substrate-binding protein
MKRFLALVIFLAACQSTPAPEETQKLQVMTSFYPIEFFATAIAGDRLDVVPLMPAGMEPHDYEPSAAQFAKMEEADLILAQGGLEPWLHDAEESLVQAGVPFVELNELLAQLPAEEHEEEHHEDEHEDEHDHGSLDPHTWLDPVLAMGMVEAIRDAFIELDPEGETLYTQNAEELLSSLQGLDAEFKSGLSECSKSDFVTAHNAFQYLAKRYNLKAHGVSGFSPHDEPSVQALSALKEEVEALGLTHIYFEAGANADVAQVLADEAGVSPLVLSTVEFLTEDQLEQEETYFSLMRQNLIQLRTGLQCK